MVKFVWVIESTVTSTEVNGMIYLSNWKLEDVCSSAVRARNRQAELEESYPHTYYSITKKQLL